jgi:ketosteroid isomerase-like protein
MALHLVTDELSHEQTLRIAYSAWARGDDAGVLAMVTEDCEFNLVGNPVLNPHSGLRVGHAGLREVMRLFHAEFAVREFIIEKMIIQDDDAAVHWHSSLELLRVGRVVETERCDLVTFRGSLMRKMLCFYDSASMAVLTGRAQATAIDKPADITRKA